MKKARFQRLAKTGCFYDRIFYRALFFLWEAMLPVKTG